MAKYRCTVCNHIYDERVEGTKFADLPDSWKCPICGSPKSVFVLLSEETIPEGKQVDMTVSDVLVAQMVEWGVRHVFGIPGTSSLGVVDAIRKHPEIQYIQVRHEQTAAFMASAYGKLTGNIAACLTIAGPGATNLATGLYDAKLDASPVLALTGLVKRQQIGPGSFQEIDQHSFFEPICVFNKILMSEDQTTMLTTLAIKHALAERGVAHLSVPNDVQQLPLSTEILPMKGRIPNMAIGPTKSMIKKAAEHIDNSKRPVIISGFGAIKQGEKLRMLAEKISAPIVTTFRGKGVIDEDDEIYAGSHGTIGSTAASELVRKSDLLIVIGSSFSEMTQIPDKPIVQVDINPLHLAKAHGILSGLCGNSCVVISATSGRGKGKKRCGVPGGDQAAEERVDGAAGCRSGLGCKPDTASVYH